jgi:hypothetical protein
MRYAFLILITISFTASAQLAGVYSRDGEVYSFHSNESTFDWIQITSETTYGNGDFIIKGKQLELKFKKARLQFEMQIDELKPSGNNKSIIEVRIMYSNGHPVTGASVTLLHSGIRQFVSELGVLKLELSNPLDQDKIIIEAGDRKSYEIPRTLRGYNTLLGIVIDETNQYRDDVVETYSFRKKRSKILLNRKAFIKSRTGRDLF